MATATERRPIPGLPGYEFGADGSVWSRWVRGSKKHRLAEAWHEVKSRLNPRCKYLYVTLKSPHGKRHFRVNVLILWAFSGHRPEGLDAAHDDGDRRNNRIENLAWKTRGQNTVDKFRHGTVLRGEAIPSAKLDAGSAARVKAAIARGETFAGIGRQHRVNEATIRKIARGKTWKHVEAVA